MEWLTNNWLTVVPLVGAAMGWAWAAAVQAWTLRQQQDQREWARLAELVKILNNPDGKQGRWDQMAAVLELHGLKKKKKIVLRVAKEARDHFAASGNPQLVAELDALISEMGG